MNYFTYFKPSGERNTSRSEEEWVSIEGTVTIQDEGGIELAERLAERYWDLSDPGRAQTLQDWRDHANQLQLLELNPSRIRSYT